MAFLRAVDAVHGKKEEVAIERPAPISPLAQLAREASEGNTEAIASLLKELAPKMIRSVHALMGSAHPDVDDVVQQSLIGLVQALPAFRGECSPAHYASRIVARAAVAARKRAKLRGTRHDDAIDVDTVAEGGEAAHDEVASARRKELVRELLDELPEEQGEVIALRIALGLSLGEVAQATGAPLNTVRSRIRLAKVALRKRIESDPTLLAALEVER